MTDEDIKDILCPYCKSQTQVMSRTYNIKLGSHITKLQCMANPKNHQFRIDEKGNVIGEKDE